MKAFDHPGRNVNRIWFSAAAAVVVVLITISIFFNTNNQQDKYSVDDPMEAFEVTRASLMMVSEGLNKGKTYSNELVKFEEAKKRIETH